MVTHPCTGEVFELLDRVCALDHRRTYSGVQRAQQRLVQALVNQPRL